MDPISVSHLVQDRTDELQRTADQVRRERSLRSKLATAAATVPGVETPRPADAVARAETASPAEARPSPAQARPAEPRPSPSEAAGCTSAEHAA